MSARHQTWQRVTLLHDMAQSGELAKARLLLEHGAEIDAVDDEYRSTPLGFAARWGQTAMVAWLLERGADPNRAGASGARRWPGRARRVMATSSERSWPPGLHDAPFRPTIGARPLTSLQEGRTHHERSHSSFRCRPWNRDSRRAGDHLRATSIAAPSISSRRRTSSGCATRPAPASRRCCSAIRRSRART